MNRVFAVAASLALVGFAGPAFADRETAPGQDRTCLITFKDAAAAEGGANADITNTKYLPRKAADKQASKDDSKRTFDYPTGSPGFGSNTEEVCAALDPS